MRRNFRNLFAVGSFLLGATLFAQEKTVTGTVKDQDGLPVADAVVKTSGGKEVYTDENGDSQLRQIKVTIFILSH